jgi:hypothetical protein
MSADSHEDPVRQQAIARLDASHDADPQKSPFGYFSSDDWPGGAGMFHWYDSAEALMHGIAQDLPTAVGDMDGDELAEYLAELAAVVAKFPPGSRVSAECFAALQEALSGFQSLQWMGTFEELRKSSDEWPAEVRSNFRDFSDEDADESEEDDLDHNARPIELDEVDEFVTYLLEYGF